MKLSPELKKNYEEFDKALDALINKLNADCEKINESKEKNQKNKKSQMDVVWEEIVRKQLDEGAVWSDL